MGVIGWPMDDWGQLSPCTKVASKFLSREGGDTFATSMGVSPVLPVKYYIERWLRKAGNQIGCTIKVDIATLLTSQGKFASFVLKLTFENP